MTAFHPENVHYGEERCPPGESQVVVLAVPRADGAAAVRVRWLPCDWVAVPEEGEALASPSDPG